MSANPLPQRGVIEAFYGVYYTFPERNDMIRFLGKHGFNLYIYGPKNDRQHRARWWEPYPDEIMVQFGETLTIGRAVGVEFCYAISPISYASDADFDQLTAKLQSFFDLGVRSFSVLMDDLTPDVPEAHLDTVYVTFAHLHVAICNKLFAWLRSLSQECTLSMCPIDYHGTAPFSNYLRVLGEGLDPAIDVMYTGPEVCSREVTRDHIDEVARVLCRPPLLWDNYPVNDLGMRSQLHLGPIRYRDATLTEAVRGYVINPMLQPEASKIALLTFADYFRDQHAYDPDSSWERALRIVGGQASFSALRQFGENVFASVLDRDIPPRLVVLAEAAIAALNNGERFSESAAVKALGTYIDTLDESCYSLKNRMPNLQLRADLLPWIEALEDWLWMGKRALIVLERIEQGEPYAWYLRLMEESLRDIERHNKRIGGNGLQQLAEYVREQIKLVTPAELPGEANPLPIALDPPLRAQG